MKKRIWIVAIIVMFLLIVPIPTGTYKDGGTRTYTSLTYKLVDWNHLYGDGNVYDKTRIYPFPMNFMSLDALLDREEKYFEYSGNTENTQEAQELSSVKECSFEAQYIRTDGYHEEIKYPTVKVIRSVGELKDYYEKNKDIYSLESREDIASDSTIGFLDACEKYDENYFEKQILVVVVLEEGSGSIRHEVEKVSVGTENDKTVMTVEIESKVPEAMTCDMAEWHILIEPEEGIDVEKPVDIQVFLDGVYKNGNTKTVKHSKGYANITFELLDGWAYEINNNEENDDFDISIYPLLQPLQKLTLSYYTMFGVCGTELKQENITLGRYTAAQGTYGKSKVWTYIKLKDTPGNYIISNYCSEEFYLENKKEIMAILSTLVVGEGSVNESYAVETAKKTVNIEYENIWSTFDSKNGVWNVEFRNPGADGCSQIVSIRYDGQIDDRVFSE